MKYLSIEVAHLYGTWSKEQDQSIKILQKFLRTHRGPSKVCVLVDNYHVPESVSQIPIIEERVASAGIFLEADLEKDALILLEKIPKTFKNEKVYLKGTNILLKNKDRLTCPLLTSCWYIKRSQNSLGLLNILPRKFESNEKKVLHILKSLELRITLNYLFFDEVENESI